MDIQTKQALLGLSDLMEESTEICMKKIKTQDEKINLLQQLIETSNKQVVQLQEQVNNMSEWLSTVSNAVKTLVENRE